MRLLALMFCALAWSGSALAQDTELAQQHFAQASRAFDAGDLEEALRLFRAAYETAPRAAVRFNIAVCLERLGRFREASQEYEAATDPNELDGAQLERARSEAARLRAILARAQVVGEPSGADVRVDGISVCTLPCTAEVDPGSRLISIHAEGRSAERGVRVDRGQRLTVELRITGLESEPSAPVTRSEPVTAIEDDEPSDGGHHIGWLTGVGASALALGVGGVIGFGLRTQSLHDQWESGGPSSVRDEGLTMRAMTNASIGVAVVGGILILIDVVLALKRRPSVDRASNRAVGVRF